MPVMVNYTSISNIPLSRVLTMTGLHFSPYPANVFALTDMLQDVKGFMSDNFHVVLFCTSTADSLPPLGV